jgi:predicted CxxxxCH...CXXCH cytochrome family protein
MRRVAWVGAAAAAFAFALVGCGESRPAAQPVGEASSCGSCHTTPGQPLPFRDPNGSTDRTQVSVGAHDAHLDPAAGEGPNLTQPIACSECHTVPRTVDDPGHLEDAPTDIRFGPLATTGGTTPSFGPVTGGQGCSASYCHGGFPGGNNANAPVWTGTGQAECGSCHDLPPPTGRHAIHVAAAVDCTVCHGPVEPDTHVNGVKTIVLPIWDPSVGGCAASSCHGPRVWEPLTATP